MEVGGVVMDEKDEGLTRLTDLDVTWGFDLHAFLQERSQEASVADDAGDGTAETMDSSQGGAVDTSSVPAERDESGSDASATSGTDQGNGEGPPAVLSGRAAHQLSSWGRLPPTVMGRTRGQSQPLQDESAQRQRVIENAMSAAVQKWTEFGSIPANTSWTTEDATAMMAGGPAAEENTGE